MKHRADADPPPSRDNIDAAVPLYINLAIAAHRDGRPDPHPWFTDACAFANDLDMRAFAAAGQKPTINYAPSRDETSLRETLNK